MIRRRLRTIPLVIALWMILTVTLPTLLLVTVVVDATRAAFRRVPWIATRLIAMAWVYLAAEVGVIIVAFAQWLASLAFGTRAADKRRDWSYWLQTAWVKPIMAAMTRTFRLRFEVKGGELVSPGPVLVLFRHVSIMDNLLPHVFVSIPAGLRLRWVLKKELLSDPALDIGGNRMPNYFVDRKSDDPETERANIAALGTGLGPRDGVMLFPEGTRYSPERRQRLMTRLAESDPDLHDLLAPHEGVLPPRPGGVLALLDEGMDVLLAAHAGFEALRGIKEIWREAPVGRTISLSFRRVAASAIPESTAARIRWLHEEWAWVGAEVNSLSGNPA